LSLALFILCIFYGSCDHVVLLEARKDWVVVRSKAPDLESTKAAVPGGPRRSPFGGRRFPSGHSSQVFSAKNRGRIRRSFCGGLKSCAIRFRPPNPFFVRYPKINTRRVATTGGLPRRGRNFPQKPILLAFKKT